MQDSFQSTTITKAPVPTEPQSKGNGLLKHSRLILGVFAAAVILGGYYFLTVYRENQIQDAQAAILRQATKLDNIGEFTPYKEKGGGLYSGSRNSPEIAQKALIQRQLGLVKPLDVNGSPSEEGKIGFIYIGDPYTAGEFSTLSDFLDGNSQANSSLVLVDGSGSELEAGYWQKSLFVWESLKDKVSAQELNSKQAQILWINLGFAKYEDNMSLDVQNHANLLEGILKKYLVKYPETKLIYLSSPRYSGLSKDPNYQEPQSYEVGFAVRELINRQERGDLVFRDSVTVLRSEPALLWGPYLWSSSTSGSGQFTYSADNYAEDGLSLTVQGKQRFAVDLFDFWSSYDFSKSWFNP